MLNDFFVLFSRSTVLEFRFKDVYLYFQKIIFFLEKKKKERKKDRGREKCFVMGRGKKKGLDKELKLS